MTTNDLNRLSTLGSRTEVTDFFDNVTLIRDRCKEIERFSWTSLRYQNDILRLILQNREKGGCIVEVGCFRGGLSAQLAYLAKVLTKKFYALDIDETAVATTVDTLSEFNLQDDVLVFQGLAIPSFSPLK